ncbi:hypothetical protein JQK15_23105 [Sphingobium sp. BHU LFT2]|nr:hypothetical protein [Sphingobium sp. BHU LFT2]MBT2246400.1 hypothetical protein [Sphingobium sp. BHU LFT2]
MLDGQFLADVSISAAQSAAGIEDILRDFQLPRFKVGKSVPVIQLGH